MLLDKGWRMNSKHSSRERSMTIYLILEILIRKTWLLLWPTRSLAHFHLTYSMTLRHQMKRIESNFMTILGTQCAELQTLTSLRCVSMTNGCKTEKNRRNSMLVFLIIEITEELAYSQSIHASCTSVFALLLFNLFSE